MHTRKRCRRGWSKAAAPSPCRRGGSRPRSAALLDALGLPSDLEYMAFVPATLDGADLLAVVTEWQEFRNPDFDQFKARMKGAAVADGRNVYDPAHMAGWSTRRR